MARLYRPPVPLEVQYRVALRQLGTLWIDQAVREAKKERRLGHWVGYAKGRLADLLGCTVKDLRLDHNPPLAARQRNGEGKNTVYTPDANDPEFLAYRPHGTQFAGSHDVKTRIRGDHGQYSDLVLIKRERRRQKKRTSEKRTKVRPPKRKWPSRPFAKRRKP
jgi:hypothetical protein